VEAVGHEGAGNKVGTYREVLTCSSPGGSPYATTSIGRPFGGYPSHASAATTARSVRPTPPPRLAQSDHTGSLRLPRHQLERKNERHLPRGRTRRNTLERLRNSGRREYTRYRRCGRGIRAFGFQGCRPGPILRPVNVTPQTPERFRPRRTKSWASFASLSARTLLDRIYRPPCCSLLLAASSGSRRTEGQFVTVVSEEPLPL
jgi:hypothetical protein